MILYLVNNALRQIYGEDIALKVWKKVKEFYLTKSLTNRVLLKEKFFGFKMDRTKNIKQNLNDFKKIALL